MARGSKAKYTEKQKRQAEDIAEGYMNRGVSRTEAKRRAWATVNKIYGGGQKGGSARGRMNKAPIYEGGRKGGAASAARPASARSASARKAARTRARRAP